MTERRGPRNYVADVERAMRDCPRCQRHDPDIRERHRIRVLHEILAKQSRPALLLPAHVWPNGKAPA